MTQKDEAIHWLENLDDKDVSLVGSKNASPGEMTRALKVERIRVPEGNQE